MKKTLIKRIEELGAEASSLLKLKNQYEQKLQEIDMRLNQIAGAITEMDSIIKEAEDEVGNISE